MNNYSKKINYNIRIDNLINVDHGHKHTLNDKILSNFLAINQKKYLSIKIIQVNCHPS